MRTVTPATILLVLAALAAPAAFAQSQLPDFAIESVGVNPPQPIEGQSVTVLASLRNNGTVGGHVVVAFYIDGMMIDSKVVYAAPGTGPAIMLQSAPWRAVSGSHSAVVKADPNNQVQESNEWNNAGSRSFTVIHGDPAPADLAITALHPNRSPVQPGDWITFYAGVQNRGASASQATIVRFVVGNLALGDAFVPALQPGQSAVAASPQWCATLGSHTASATVDPAAQQPDSDRSNNVRTVRFGFGFDLSPEDQGASFLPGETKSFSIDVKSTGTANDTIVLSKVVPVGWSATVTPSSLNLPAGATASVSVKVTAPLALTGEATIRVKGTSTGDPGVFDEVRIHGRLPL